MLGNHLIATIAFRISNILDAEPSAVNEVRRFTVLSRGRLKRRSRSFTENHALRSFQNFDACMTCNRARKSAFSARSRSISASSN